MAEVTTVEDRREFGSTRLRGRIWWIRYRLDGREHWESPHSTSEREAEKLLAQRQAERRIGHFTAPDVRRTTIGDLAQMLRDDYRINGHRSLKRAENSLTHLLAAFSGSRATTVTGDRIAAYIRDRLDDKAAPSTIRNELAALKRMFTLGIRAGKVTQRPHIPAIQVSNARQGFFEHADFAALLLELPDYARPVVEFAYYTGWRIPSEVLRLTWAQVDFSAGVVRLEPRTTKNDEGRTFPFDALPELAALLRAQRERTTEIERRLGIIVTAVFHHDGKPIRYFRRAWRSACRRAAIVGNGKLARVVRPDLLERIPHDFRRTAVRNMVRAGVPERVAMQLTGHKTRSVFDRYNIVNERDLREGVSKLAALHGARPLALVAGGQPGDNVVTVGTLRAG